MCTRVRLPVLTSSDSSGHVDGHSPATLPAALFLTWETGNSGIVGNAEHLTTLAAESGTEVASLPVDTDDHSLALVENHPSVRDFVTDAVATCT